MKADWQSDDGSVVLYRGDCLSIIPQLEPGSVDAVVTDPPYGVGFKYNNHDDAESLYVGIVDRVLQAESVLSAGGFMAVYQAAKHARKWVEWFPREWSLLALPKNFVQGGRGALVPATDYVLWWRCGDGPKPRTWQDFMARDWFACNTVPAKRDPLTRGHPCPRPLDGVTYAVKCFAPSGAMVLDPFMGSGTTGVACVRTGRRFIGIELDEGYFEIAKKRIQAAIRERSEQLIPA